MVGLNKILATIAITVIILAFTAPALAQAMPEASPTMTPARMPTIAPGMQGSTMQPVPTTMSGKDTMSTLQGMMDMRVMVLMMKAASSESMISGKQVTMFVPNDLALQKMGMDRISMIMKDKQMATNVMRGLMTDGTMMPPDMTDGKTITMMDGKTMTVKMTGGQMMIDGAKVMKAVRTSNGMIYVIDNMPSSMMSMMQTGAGPAGTGQMGAVPMSR